MMRIVSVGSSSLRTKSCGSHDRGENALICRLQEAGRLLFQVRGSPTRFHGFSFTRRRTRSFGRAPLWSLRNSSSRILSYPSSSHRLSRTTIWGEKRLRPGPLTRLATLLPYSRLVFLPLYCASHANTYIHLFYIYVYIYSIRDFRLSITAIVLSEYLGFNVDDSSTLHRLWSRSFNISNNFMSICNMHV